MKKENRK